MSRVTYKGLQMEWAADECAEPLPRPQTLIRKENTSSRPKKPAAMINRFDLLDLDGTEDESDEEARTEHFSTQDNGTGYGKEISWADSGIAAT
jgi:hypothetical protein